MGRMNIIALLLCVAGVNASPTDRFALREPSTGVTHGPFEFKNNATVTLDGRQFALQVIPPPAAVTKSRHEIALEVVAEMRQTILPTVQFRQASLDDAVAILNKAAREHIEESHSGTSKGFVFVLNVPHTATNRLSRSVTFDARDITIWETLQMVTRVAGITFRVEGRTVMLVPTDYAGEMIVRMYTIAPHIRVLLDRHSEGGNRNDMLKAYFTKVWGWPCPRGSELSYEPELNTLVLKSDEPSLRYMEPIIEELNSSLPAVQTTNDESGGQGDQPR